MENTMAPAPAAQSTTDPAAWHFPPNGLTNNRQPQAPSHRKRWFWIVGSIILVVACAGGGYFAYAKGLISIPFLTPKTDVLFDKMVAAISDIKSAQYGLHVSIVAENRIGNAKPIVVPSANSNSNANTNQALLDNRALGAINALTGIFTPDALYKMLPLDMNLRGGVTFYFEADKSADSADALLKIDGSYSASDTSMALEAEARKIGTSVYALVTKFPTLFFFDLSAIKDKWIAISPDDDSNILSSDTFKNFDNIKKEESLKTTLQSAFKQNLFVVDKHLSPEVIAGVKSEHYVLSMHPDRLAAVFQDLINAKRAKSEDTKSLEAAMQQAGESVTQSVLTQVAANAQFEVWVDKVHGYLRQVKITYTFVPPDSVERLKQKQFVLQTELTLEHVNEKVNVDKPGQSINYAEAERLISGISKEEQQFEKQITQLNTIKTSLRFYHDRRSAYPDSLDQLRSEYPTIKKECDDEAKQRANNNAVTRGLTNSTCSYASYYSDAPPKIDDLYTKKPYGYTTDGDQYTLTYELKYYDGITDYAKQQYKDGTNTTTSDESSLGIPYFGGNQGTTSHDTKRISDVREIQSALELYYNDQTTPGYPVQPQPGLITNALLGAGNYLSTIPTPPTPADNASGSTMCTDGTDGTNAYRYQSLKSEKGDVCSQAPCGWYEIKFCTGSASGGLTAGMQTASPTGLTSVPTNSGTNTNTNTTRNSNANANTNVVTNTNTVNANVDSDHDVLTDAQEKIYGTNPNKADTDGDGYSDYTEVTNGYNPNGSGKMPGS